MITSFPCQGRAKDAGRGGVMSPPRGGPASGWAAAAGRRSGLGPGEGCLGPAAPFGELGGVLATSELEELQVMLVVNPPPGLLAMGLSEEEQGGRQPRGAVPGSAAAPGVVRGAPAPAVAPGPQPTPQPADAVTPRTPEPPTGSGMCSVGRGGGRRGPHQCSISPSAIRGRQDWGLGLLGSPALLEGSRSLPCPRAAMHPAFI